MKNTKRYAVRVLDVKDVSAFRDLLLCAFKTEGEFLGPTYEDEVLKSDEQWRKKVSPTEHMHYFGLFDRGDLIGVMKAAPWDEDASGSTALWGCAYLKPEYRGQKLAKLLYVAREAWTLKHPDYTSVVLFIRHDNNRSQSIHLRHGAQMLFSRIMEWPHRQPSVWNWYRVTFVKAVAQKLAA